MRRKRGNAGGGDHSSFSREQGQEEFPSTAEGIKLKQERASTSSTKIRRKKEMSVDLEVEGIHA